jgi:hypothetical protein
MTKIRSNFRQPQCYSLSPQDESRLECRISKCRISVDTLDGILTPLLQYVQERTNTADEDAWTGEAAVEYVCANLSEQVSFAPAMTGKLKADTLSKEITGTMVD